MLDSISVEPYETNVESCVGKDSEALRRPRLYTGFRFQGLYRLLLVMSVYLLDLLLRYDVVVLEYCYYYCYYLMTQFLLTLFFTLRNLVRLVGYEYMEVL